MSKIENLNKVSKKKTGFLNCDENALKNIILLKKCVTITFFGFRGTKSGIQVFQNRQNSQKFTYKCVTIIQLKIYCVK